MFYRIWAQSQDLFIVPVFIYNSRNHTADLPFWHNTALKITVSLTCGHSFMYIKVNKIMKDENVGLKMLATTGHR